MPHSAIRYLCDAALVATPPDGSVRDTAFAGLRAVADAATDVFETGRVAVADMLERRQWCAEIPVSSTVDVAVRNDIEP